MAIDASVPLTPKALGDHLWESENRTRNKISNPKDYVLALLFFKRACDRYAEETAAALEELADVPDAVDIIGANPNAYHDLLIPDGCFWSDVRNTDEDRLGRAVNDALLGISTANPSSSTESSRRSTSTTNAHSRRRRWLTSSITSRRSG